MISKFSMGRNSTFFFSMILFYIYNLYEYDYQYLHSKLLEIKKKYGILKKESNVQVFKIG